MLFNSINYIENEGFNPTDDGVILAQSYRMLNGEIAHKDFISIRPVFSGILHSIHFFSSLPLMISARWFVVLQYLSGAFVWAWLLMQFVNIDKQSVAKRMAVFSFLSIATFVLNGINYNIFPWTTIDAVWYSIGSVFFLYQFLQNESKQIRSLIFATASLFLISLSAISRQTFALPALLLFGFFAYSYFKEKKLHFILISSFLGALPLLLYFVFLLKNNSIHLFISQMTGRSEIFQTGILRFIKSFLKSYLLGLHIISILIIYLATWRKKWDWNRNAPKVLAKLTIFYLLASIGFVVWYFTLKNQTVMVLKVPFELFWNWIFVFVIAYTTCLNRNEKILSICITVLAWTSSISLGDNSPVFVGGILFSAMVVFSFLTLNRLEINEQQKRFPQISQISADKKNKISVNLRDLREMITKYTVVLFTVPTILLFSLSIYSQHIQNYRDLPTNELKSNLGKLIPKFGNIQTNNSLYEYYENLIAILNQLKDYKNNFVLFPDNAAIYPLLDSRNPLPCDWLQIDEFVGNTDYLMQKINALRAKQSFYLIVSIYNVKTLAWNKTEQTFPASEYPFLEELLKNSSLLPIENKFFRVYKIRKR